MSWVLHENWASPWLGKLSKVSDEGRMEPTSKLELHIVTLGPLTGREISLWAQVVLPGASRSRPLLGYLLSWTSFVCLAFSGQVRPLLAIYCFLSEPKPRPCSLSCFWLGSPWPNPSHLFLSWLCCREGDPFQGPRVGSCLSQKWIVQGDT